LVWQFNTTASAVTIGAVTISIGRVVDDSIVVVENIKRHIELGEEKLYAITTAVNEALEMAAKECEKISGNEPSGARFGALDSAEAIRKLKV
jgi:Cu/Ag efflux pump CusA